MKAPRIFPICLVSFSIAACGGDPPPPPAAPTPPPTPTPAASTAPAPATATPATTASAPAKPQVPWRTLFDFGSLPSRASKPDDKKIVALAADIKKAHKECATAAGTITSQSERQGAFTKKGAVEDAYVIEWDCNPKGGTNAALIFHHLLVTAEGKVTREVEIPEQWIGGMSDVDADGDNELVLVEAAGKLGARLVELADAKDGQLAVIFAWKDLGTNTCPAGGGEVDAPKILYRTTDTPEFDAERAKRPCTPPKK